MKLPVTDATGKKLSDFELNDALLEFEKGGQAVHQAVVATRANRRAGTASTLGKSEVRGAGTKPWRQKGLGRARSGTRQSPVWRGGGVVFGPRPRDMGKKLTRKQARLAFRRAFSEKAKAGEIKLLDALALDEPRTRLLTSVLDKLALDGGVLLVVDQVDQNLALASRNLPGVDVTAARRVSTYDLLCYPNVVVTQAGMAQLEERLQPQKVTS